MVVIPYIDKKCDTGSMLDSIDKSLAAYSSDILNEIRFRIKSCVNLDDAAILSDLRRILDDKLRGSACFEKYSTQDIIFIIKKYLN